MPLTPAVLPSAVRELPMIPEGLETDELVTVVVPARDEEHHLGACLDAVRAQAYQNLQIIVVDGGSVDGTAAIVRRHAAQDSRIELLHNERHLITVSLNVAAAHARGRWLVRVDAHSTIGPEYVALVVSRLREGRWAGVGGRKNGVGATPAGRAIAAAMGSRFGVGGSVYHHGTDAREVDHIPFGAYPVELVRRLGGWDERLVANEDFEFDHRVRCSGGHLLFDPRIVIHWRSRQSMGDLFGQYRRYGRGKVDVVMLHPRSMSPRHVVPPAFVAYAAFAGVTAVRRPRRALAVLAPYLIGLAAASGITGRRLESSHERAWLVPAFLTMHVGWGVGFWHGVIRVIAGRGTLRGGR